MQLNYGQNVGVVLMILVYGLWREGFYVSQPKNTLLGMFFILLIIRLSPPLVITPEEINKSAEIISTVFKMAEQLNPDFTPSEAARFNTPSLGEGDIQFIQARRMEKLRKQNEFLSNSQSTFANNLTQNNAPSNQSQKTKQTEKEIQNTDDGSTIV